MATNHPGKVARWALWAPLVIVPAAFFAAVPWLEQQKEALVMGISAVCSIFMVAYSMFVAERLTRRLDEVQVAGQRFATTKGMTIGTFIALLVIVFPPAMNVLVDLAFINGMEPPDKAVKLAITIGFMLVVIMQTLSIAVVSVWWGRRVMESRA